MLNKERLLKLADVIEATPQGDVASGTPGFNMQAWNEAICPYTPENSEEPQEDCGTVACIGGTAEALFAEGRRGHAYMALTIEPEYPEDHFKLKALFYPGWTQAYGHNEHENTGWKATPAQAATVIRHLVDTGEVDWSIIE